MAMVEFLAQEPINCMKSVAQRDIQRDIGGWDGGRLVG